MIRRRFPPATVMIMVAGLSASIFFGLRYAELTRTVNANKAAMAAHIRNESGSAEDASVRVARAVEADEALFNTTLHAVAAKRTAGIVSLVALGVACVALSVWLNARRVVATHPQRR